MMSENNDLWYVNISLCTGIESLEVQTFCNQCCEIIFQERSKKTCPCCNSEKWASNYTTNEYRQMLRKLQQDANFRNLIKIKYKKIWDDKFPKYKIPDPHTVGKLMPANLKNSSEDGTNYN